MKNFIIIFHLMILFFSCNKDSSKLAKLDLKAGQSVVTIGGNLCSRMTHYDYFQAYLHAHTKGKNIVYRNMCDGGDTPGFRPHSGRYSPWAFPGAEKFQTEFANKSGSEGHLASPDEWLTRYKADVILSFFGYSESFDGPDSLPKYKAELEAFIRHTKTQKYNGSAPPKLILVSPTAFENVTATMDVPDGDTANKNLAAYTKMMAQVAAEQEVDFIDAFHPSKEWSKGNDNITIDGAQLNDDGYKKFAALLMDKLFGQKETNIDNKLMELVKDKNWFWTNLFKIPNGVHVFGRRYNPFGQDNYPAELKKMDEMTSIRDTAIWSLVSGKSYDVAEADNKTTVVPEIKTNYITPKGMEPRYLYGEEAMSKFTVAPGFQAELFASEKEFPDLANPVQMSFDNKGRLWVAVMPTYPHYKPGDQRPNDKLLILEDTNNDGKADKQIIFADHLHLPIGFEFAPEGVYVSQSENLKLLIDTNNDDKADKEEIIFSGFDDHDTHHAISAFCADPSGSIIMEEGVFLHTSVETPYGTVRATNGGFYRFNPIRRHLERYAQLSIPNPWGVAFDDWGQDIFLETSGVDVRWLMPGTIKPVYGIASPKSASLIEEKHRVRPTSGIEFVSSRHFPDSMQTDMMYHNTIGFLGTKQHVVIDDDSTGFKTRFRQDLIKSTDPNFRPVDLEIAPDGSLYMIDWHNVLIGHMQHNARDPLRDHVHGRVYRITCKDRPLVKPAKVYGATIPELLDNLKLPEYRTRYRTKRELRGRNVAEVLATTKAWVAKLDMADKNYEHNLLEALWVTWGINKVDNALLEKVLSAKDYRARAAAVRVLRYMSHQVPNYKELFAKAASDDHGRVRLEAVVAASWQDKGLGLKVLDLAEKKPVDRWMEETYKAVRTNFTTRIKPEEISNENDLVSGLKGNDLKLLQNGRKLYEKEGNCITCHQTNGNGLLASGFPPLANSEWVKDEKKLIQVTLNGLMGPITVKGIKYDGKVPMVPYGKTFTDEEIAAVLTYVRRSWGNRLDPVQPASVAKVRKETAAKNGYYLGSELQ